jgi:hypothetical protein
LSPLAVKQIDDIFAALILSLAMLRRLEVKATTHEHNAGVPRELFEEWRRKALRAYDQVALASAAKVLLNMGWYYLAMNGRIALTLVQVGGALLFCTWICALIWAWKIATDARVLRLSHGIRLRRESAPVSASKKPG